MDVRRVHRPKAGPCLIVASAVIALTCSACLGTGASDVADEAELGDSVAAESAAPAVADQPLVGLLYVAQAEAASVEGAGAELSVTLSGTDAEVLWFQDRPGRQAGEMRMSDLVDDWAELGFVEDPPNAVLRHDGNDLGSVVQMSDPLWNQPEGTLAFTAVLAEGSEELPVLLSDVSMFIDDSGSTSDLAAKVQVSNAQPGQTIELAIAGAGGDGPSWSLGATGADGYGMQLSGSSGEIPVTSFELDASELRMTTSASSGGTGAISFEVDLFLVVPASASALSVSSSSDPGVEVQLAIGGSPPQPVNQTATEFALQT